MIDRTLRVLIEKYFDIAGQYWIEALIFKIKDSVHTQQVFRTVPFNTGDKVRILDLKEKLDNGKKQTIEESYTIDKKESKK